MHEDDGARRAQQHRRTYVLIALGTLCLVLVALIIGYHELSAAQTGARGSNAYWQSAMKDEERCQLMATPAPYQFETVREAAAPRFYRGDVTKREIALTFDDGPHPDTTPPLLKVLREHRVKATFFVVGMRAEQYPDLVKQMVADGHTVANHTYHHDRLTHVTPVEASLQIRTCSEVLKKITGKTPKFFRPPGGSFDADVLGIAERQKYTTVLWTINTGDFQRPPAEKIEEHVMQAAANGSIILFHDGVPQTVEALPQIFAVLRERGYKLVTLDEMAKEHHSP